MQINLDIVANKTQSQAAEMLVIYIKNIQQVQHASSRIDRRYQA
jgi:hypothetical protein